ncbi:hypothetical protein [Alienimonas sp. DA493]|uniref:hypothetical protein n=1 Tax=Alienimonas sp. DA493 TaxID=3373605 RepID=UPI003754814C
MLHRMNVIWKACQSCGNDAPHGVRKDGAKNRVRAHCLACELEPARTSESSPTPGEPEPGGVPFELEDDHRTPEQSDGRYGLEAGEAFAADFYGAAELERMRANQAELEAEKQAKRARKAARKNGPVLLEAGV